MSEYCPFCNNAIALPKNSEGAKFHCPYCEKLFIVQDGRPVAPLRQIKQPQLFPVQNIKTKIPGLTLAAFIILYCELVISIFGNIRNFDAASCNGIIYALGCAAFTACAHSGYNWGRITITSMLGLTLVVSALINFFLFAFFAISFGAPLVFLWLPCSNRWFRAKKLERMTK